MTEKWLHDQKFTDVKHIQPPRTVGCLWTVVARPDHTPSTSESALIFQTGEAVVTVRPWTKKTPVCYESWNSRGSRWIAGEVPPDAQDDTGGVTASPEKKKQKTEAHTQPSQGAKRLFDDISGPRGTAIWDLGGSGDCGYRAIAAAVASRSGKSEKEILENLPALTKTVRSKGHQWLTQNQDWRQSWALDTRANHVAEAGALPTTPDQYLEAVQRPSRWLDGHIAQAMATALQTDFLAFERQQGGKWRMSARIQAEQSKLHDPIILLLSNDHYRTIRDHINFPPEWKKSTPKGQFQRAAGKSTASDKSFSSWVKPAHVIVKHKSGSSIDKPKSSKKFDKTWLKPADSVQSKASLKSKTNGPATECSTSCKRTGTAQPKSKVEEKHRWVCPLCDMEITVSGSRHVLRYKKNNHLRYRHKGEDLSQVPTLRPVPAPVCVVSYNLPPAAVAWKCPWCPAQLPALGSNALNAAVKLHIHTKHKGKTPKQLYSARWKKEILC